MLDKSPNPPLVPFPSQFSALPFHDDIDIPVLTRPNYSNNTPIDFDYIDSLCFNPVQLNDVINSKCNTDDNEYEAVHWSEMNSQQCKYQTNTSFRSEVNSLNITEHNHLSFCHFNVRSLSKHYDEVMGFLDGIGQDFSVIGFTESWLTPQTEQIYDLPGYKSYAVSRSNRKGGGVVIYVSHTFNSCSLREDLCHYDDEGLFESVFVEVSTSDRQYLVGVVYRPPGKCVNQFNETFFPFFQSKIKANQCCVLMGDFNIDLFKSDKHSPTKTFLENLKCNYLFPMITKPTRISNQSVSLIDNIFTNFPEHNILSGILLTDISDHLPIFHIARDIITPQPAKTAYFRKKTAEAVEYFQDKIKGLDWNNVLTNSNIDEAAQRFSDIFGQVYDESFPLINSSTAKTRIRKPWISTGILNSIHRKNKLYRLSLKYPSSDNRSNYRVCRNKLNGLLKYARKNILKKSSIHATVTLNLLGK